MVESEYQSRLIKKIEKMLPGCLVLKNDPNYIQGIPDLSVLYNNKWAFLECKMVKDASHQPNQDFYISQANRMSFGQFIYPENEKEILDKLLFFMTN